MPHAGPRRQITFLLCVCLAATLSVGFALGAAPAALDGEDQPQLGDSQARIVDLGNTSNYLLPDSDGGTQDAVASQHVDVGVAVATGAETLQGHHERAAFDRRSQSAENESARIELIGEGVEDLEVRAHRLRTAHADARSSFRAGSISATEYFRTVARLDATAARAASYRDHLETQVDGGTVAGQAHLSDLRHLKADFDAMDGPATRTVRLRYEGNATAGTTFLTVTDDDGFVLATVADGQLYREAQETGDWSRDGTTDDSAALGPLINRVEDLYTWTSSHQFGYRTDFLDTSLHKIAVTHRHGELRVYLEGGTEDVFREVQQKRLNAVPLDWGRSVTADGIELTVNGSHETGPLKVGLTRAISGEGVDGEIRIDGTVVGDTDEEGRLWTVQRPGSFTVNATTAGNQTVELTVPNSSD